MANSKTSTADDLLAMGSDALTEVIQGVIVEHPYTPAATNVMQVHVFGSVFEFVSRRDLGVVTALTCGFWVEDDPDTVVTPDVGFVARERVPQPLPSDHFFHLRPDLVVEVISPIDDPGYIELKRVTYDRIRVPLLWWIDPQRELATVHVDGQQRETLDRTAILDGRDILPGFSLALAEVFAVPDS